jgi:cobalamin synthase
VRRIGGITGDTIGAAIEISLTVSLVVASATHSVLG